MNGKVFYIGSKRFHFRTGGRGVSEKQKDYVEIGTLFERALKGIKLDLSFERAIRSMKITPELVAKIKCWDETVWLCIQEHLNGNPDMSENSNEIFLHACALLEN